MSEDINVAVGDEVIITDDSRGYPALWKVLNIEGAHAEITPVYAAFRYEPTDGLTVISKVNDDE